MDSIKAAAKAIRDSPKMIRKRTTSPGPGHTKLNDDWLHSQDSVESGVSFYVKYLGSTEVDKTHGPGTTDVAVKMIVQHAKTRSGSNAKLQKVQLTISSKSIIIKNIADDTKLGEEPLHRVSYCTVDPFFTNVFCYTTRNRATRTPECHAFLCAKKSKAEAITLSVAQAFNIAYEAWQEKKKVLPNGGTAPAKKRNASTDPQTEQLSSPKSPSVDVGTFIDDVQKTQKVSPVPTIQTTLVETPPVSKANKNPFYNEYESTLASNLEVKATLTKAKSMDQLQMDDELDMEFTQLADARSNPNLLDTGGMAGKELTDDVKQYLRGDVTSPTLALGSSVDDLLNL